MRRLTVGALGLPLGACIALLAGSSAMATTTVTISQPAPGSTISKSTTPKLAVAGAVAFARPAASTAKFFLRRDGCGTSNDNPHLSVTAGNPDSGDGCGFLLGIVGATATVDHSFTTDFPTQDGMPVTFNASKPVSGVLLLQNENVNNEGVAAGQVTVTLTFEALVQGNGVSIGSVTETVTVTPPTASYPIPFSVIPNTALNRKDVSGIDLNVAISGPYVASGFIGMSGHSYVNVPTYSASFARAVQVSLDDPGFAKPVRATLNTALTSWNTTLTTPGVGQHRVYARSVQGFGSSAVVSDGFTVAS